MPTLTTVGTTVSAGPPGTATTAGDTVWPVAATMVSVDSQNFFGTIVAALNSPPGSCVIRSIPAPYSTLGQPPPYIPFRVLPTYRETVTREHMEVYQEYDVPWLLRGFWHNAMLGDSYLNDQGRLRRYLPPPHPDYLHLRPTSVECLGGIGVPSDVLGRLFFLKRDSQGALSSAYNQGFARYGVTWSSTPYDFATDQQIDDANAADDAATVPRRGELLRYVDREGDFNGEYLTISGTQLVTDDASRTPIGPVSRLLGLQSLVYSWHQVPRIPEAAITACIGKVNDKVFDNVDAVGKNCPAETLVFVGAKVRRDRTPTGRYTFTINYLFSKRDQGWNKYPLADFTFKSVKIRNPDGSLGGPPYPKVDFIQLFVP